MSNYTIPFWLFLILIGNLSYNVGRMLRMIYDILIEELGGKDDD